MKLSKEAQAAHNRLVDEVVERLKATGLPYAMANDAMHTLFDEKKVHCFINPPDKDEAYVTEFWPWSEWWRVKRHIAFQLERINNGTA